MEDYLKSKTLDKSHKEQELETPREIQEMRLGKKKKHLMRVSKEKPLNS